MNTASRVPRLSTSKGNDFPSPSSIFSWLVPKGVQIRVYLPSVNWVEERGGLAERFGLPFALEGPANVLQQTACHRQRLPAAAGGFDLAFDATEFELGDA